MRFAFSGFPEKSDATEPISFVRTASSEAAGVRPVTRRNPYRRRAAVVFPPSASIRFARTRDASTKVGSFISTSACNGSTTNWQRSA